MCWFAVVTIYCLEVPTCVLTVVAKTSDLIGPTQARTILEFACSLAHLCITGTCDLAKDSCIPFTLEELASDVQYDLVALMT